MNNNFDSYIKKKGDPYWWDGLGFALDTNDLFNLKVAIANWAKQIYDDACADTAKEILEALDSKHDDAGTGLGLEDLEEEAIRDSNATLEKIQALKKEWKVD